MAIDLQAAERVLSAIREEELVELVVDLSSIESPPGGEGEVGEAVHSWLAENSFATRRVGMFEDRFNVFAELPGAGRGPALAFNAHMDVSVSREDQLTTRDPSRPDYHLGWAEGDMLIGNPVVNDKGPMSAFMIAAKAIKEAGIRLEGSVYLGMVAGEIGQEPVDEFQGKRYLSKEVGSRYLLNHSPRPQFCLCAEATAFRKGWVEAGKAFYKVTVYGGPVLYTPFLRRPYTRAEQPNAIIRAIPLLERLEEWAYEYEQANRYECPGGTVVPKVNIGAVRSGRPWMIITNPEVFMLYLDIRTVPGQDGGLIRHTLEEMLEDLSLEGEVEQFVNRDGYEARGVEPLVAALDEAHRSEFGTAPEIATVPETSMWRDHNVYNEVGIPALTYGPPGRAGDGTYAVSKADLLRAARVYALTALSLCGGRV
jgi:acetylornithine deacetylase/succinyl-diaminopimelate desuccinylase-like protein